MTQVSSRRREASPSSWGRRGPTEQAVLTNTCKVAPLLPHVADEDTEAQMTGEEPKATSLSTGREGFGIQQVDPSAYDLTARPLRGRIQVTWSLATNPRDRRCCPNTPQAPVDTQRTPSR